ncbi:unnamed protein product, partial [Prorocentrum cordatum]
SALPPLQRAPRGAPARRGRSRASRGDEPVGPTASGGARAGHPGFRGQPAAVLEGRPAAPARRLPVPVGGPAARLRRAAGPRLAGPARAEVGRPRRGGAAGDAGHAGPSERGRAPRPRSASARGCWRQRGRTWLLIGPLVGRLQFLRDAAQRARQAAATAAPGDAAGAAARALGQPPPVVSLRVRRLETCWTEIVSKPDRVQVILSIHLDDEVDVALARAFCQESSRRPTGTRRSGPCRAPSTSPRTSTRPSTCESWGRSGCRTSASSPSPCPTKSWSPRRRRRAPASTRRPVVVTLAARIPDRLHSLARPVMTFRNFFNFHLKHAKSYLHSRLRREAVGRLAAAAQQGTPGTAQGEKVRRMASGREFRPPPRGEAAPP